MGKPQLQSTNSFLSRPFDKDAGIPAAFGQLAAIFFLFSLWACSGHGVGGTSGSSNSSTPNNNTSSAVSLSGTASAGPINAATVSVYALTSTGSRGSFLGSTTTNAKGSYALFLPASNIQPLIVAVTGGSYVEEASGTTVNLGTNEITAVLPNPSSSRTVSVTPLTHMAAQRAISMAGTGVNINSAITSANAAIAAAAGISSSLDITSINPALPTVSLASQGLSASSVQAKYGLALAAISQWGVTNGSVNSIAVMNAFAQDFTDGVLDGAANGTTVNVTGGGSLTNTSWSTGLRTAETTYVAGNAIFSASSETTPTATPVSVTASPVSHNYGPVLVGTSTGATTYTFTNGGTGIASGVYATLSGTGFTISTNTCGSVVSPISLSAGGSCSVAITFQPGTTGSASGTIALSFTAGGTSQLAGADLLGTGMAVPSLSYAASSGTVGTLGTAMSVTPSTLNTNGSAITACALSGAPALPAGLSINATTCVISGTPTATQAATTYSVVATNAAGSSSVATVSLTIVAGVPTLSYATSAGTTGAVGSLMTVTPSALTANGSALTGCSVRGFPALPASLSLNSSTCVISGTPTAAQVATTYTIVATNLIGTSAAATVSLTVSAAPPVLSYATSTGTTGTVGTAMSVTPSTLNTNGALLSACSITAGGALPAGLSLNSTSCMITGTPTATQAATTYSIVATNSAGNSTAANVTLTVNAGRPVLSYAYSSGTTGNVGAAMTVTPSTLTTNGAAITACAVSGTPLPTGLSVNATTCVISGTPSASQAAATYSIVATNSAGNSSAASVTLAVNVPVPTLSYSGSTGTTGTAGTAMSVTPTTLSGNGSSITGCALSGSSPSLPSGLTINSNTCVISGTPTTSISATVFTIIASNTGGNSPGANVTLTVNAAAPSLSYAGATGTTGNVGAAMSVSPTTLSANGSPITNCAISSGPALPSYLSLNTSTCVISGTPTSTLATTTYTIVATNAIGSSSAATVSLTVGQMHDFITTMAGPGSIVTGSYGIATDSSGNIFYADGLNYRVLMVPASTGTYFGISMTAGTAYTIAGTGSDGSTGDGGAGTSATVGLVYGLATDSSGNVYLSDGEHDVVRTINRTTGFISTLVGTSGSAGSSGDGGVATAALLSNPGPLAVDTSGNLFIGDRGNFRIRMVPAGTAVQFGISMTAGNIYTVAGTGTQGFSGDGGAGTSAKIDVPGGMAYSGNYLYFTDGANNRVRQVSQVNGNINTFAGNGVAGSTGDGGAASSAELNAPNGLAFDSGGNLYIGDYQNNKVRMVPASTSTFFGISMTASDIYTLAGTGVVGYAGDNGAGTSATLSNPAGIAVTSAGNVFVYDSGNGVIRKIQP
jgi:sugar lactone lactonase YvrE